MLVAVVHQQQLILDRQQSVMMAVQVHLVQLLAQAVVVAEQTREETVILAVAVVEVAVAAVVAVALLVKEILVARGTVVQDTVAVVVHPAQANQQDLQNQILTAQAAQE
jgi:hypothetical protein